MEMMGSTIKMISAMLNTDSNLEKEHLFDPRQCNVILLVQSTAGHFI